MPHDRQLTAEHVLKLAKTPYPTPKGERGDLLTVIHSLADKISPHRAAQTEFRHLQTPPATGQQMNELTALYRQLNTMNVVMTMLEKGTASTQEKPLMHSGVREALAKAYYQLRDGEETGRYYRGAITKAFEVLGLEPLQAAPSVGGSETGTIAR